MSFDTFVTIVFAVLTIASWLVYRFGWKYVRFGYKDQRVGVRTKWWRV